MMDDYKTLSKSLKKQTEDILYIDHLMAWVMDGATGIDGTHISDEESDAYWYVKRLDLYLKETLLTQNKTIKEILKEAIESIKNEYHKFQGYHEGIDFPSCAGVIVRKIRNTLEYYVMADCELLVEYKDGTIQEIVDHRVSKLDQIAIQAGIDASKKGNKPFCECHDAMLLIEQANRRKKNIEYFALSDDPSVVEEGISGCIELDQVQSICLMSDGFAQYFETLHLCKDAKEFMMKCKTQSVEELYDELITLQRKDKTLDAFPRFKISDDTSIIYVKLVN